MEHGPYSVERHPDTRSLPFAHLCPAGVEQRLYVTPSDPSLHRLGEKSR